MYYWVFIWTRQNPCAGISDSMKTPLKKWLRPIVHHANWFQLLMREKRKIFCRRCNSVFVGWGVNPNTGSRFKILLGFAPQPTFVSFNSVPQSTQPRLLYDPACHLALEYNHRIHHLLLENCGDFRRRSLPEFPNNRR
jgi:hypothetical protein